MRGRMCLKNPRSRFLRLVFFAVRFGLNDTSYSKNTEVSERTNRNMPAWNTTFSSVRQHWEPQCTASQTDRQTEGQTTELRQAKSKLFIFYWSSWMLDR